MLKKKIQANLREALKSGKIFEAGVLRMLLSAAHNREIEKRTHLYRDLSRQAKFSDSEFIKELEEKSRLTDEEVIEVISSEIRKRKESIVEFEKGGKEDLPAHLLEKVRGLVKKEKKELEILEKYLPEQLSEEEVKKLVKEAIEKTDAKEIKDIGKVMAELMPRVKGKADGSLVSKIVKELLIPKTY